MQVNDQVQVSKEGHQYKGHAGLVQQSAGDKPSSKCVVKLDLVDEPQEFRNDELTFLGR